MSENKTEPRDADAAATELREKITRRMEAAEALLNKRQRKEHHNLYN